MDYSDFQFGNFDPEFDLTPDITGTYQQPVFEDPPQSGLPDTFWFQNSSGTSLIKNNDLPGKIDNSFGETVKLNESQQVISKVFRMAMHGSNAFELERMLKLSFSHDDFQSNPAIGYSLFLLPLVGSIFWSCWPFGTEEDARLELKRRAGLKPVFANQCSKCSSCRYRNSISTKTEFCSKLGLPIFNNNFNCAPPSKVISHLRIAGILAVTKPEYTWDDVRAAVIFPHKADQIRVYEQYVAPKEVLSGAQYRKGILALNKLRYDTIAQQDKEKWNKFVISVCNPLIIKIQESFLKNRQNDRVANDYIQKILLPENHKSECSQILTSLKNDVLLWAGIRFYSPAYQKCDEAEKFLHRNHLRIAYAILRNECKYCIDNKTGLCKRLECKLVAYNDDIPESDRIQAIEIIGNDHQIDRQIIDRCKSMERSESLSGLTKLREFINSPQNVPLYIGAGLQDLDVLPSKKISYSTAFGWVEKKLQSNTSILRIETTIKQALGTKEGQEVIQSAILANKTIPTDKNELCLTSYEIDTTINLRKLNRCRACSYATTLYCKKYNRQFGISFSEVPAEVKEIMSIFNDTPLMVDIDPVYNAQSIDVEMENPGEELSIDLRVEKGFDEDRLWYEAQSQELEVETPTAVEFESQLDVELGEQGEGMELDDSLL